VITFLLRRIALAIPSMFGLLVITFLLIRVIPADPAAALAGDAATPAQIQAIRQHYGLNRPLYEQFALYVKQVARLDFGESQFSSRPVALDIGQRLPATLELTFCSLLVSTVLGIPLGVVAAIRHNRWPDFLLRIASVIGVALATFWIAIMLQLLFSMDLGWLPLRGRQGDAIVSLAGPTGFLLIDALVHGRPAIWWDALRHLALPVITLSLGGLATITRFVRAGMLETLQQDFVLYERAAGYPRRRLIWVYVLRNSVVAAVTQIGLLFGGLIAGAVVVESIFDWPGIGSYAVQAILTSDSKVMLAVTLLIGAVYIVVNVLVDIVHALLDPRLREEG
jgi:peptide/nickel transport system permease protein